LLPKLHTFCRLCGEPESITHGEICRQRERWTIARHEKAKWLIIHTLRTLEGVMAEPMGDEGARRNDIRIDGSRQSGHGNKEFDLTIVSLSSQASASTNLRPTEFHRAIPGSKDRGDHSETSGLGGSVQNSPPALSFGPLPAPGVLLGWDDGEIDFGRVQEVERVYDRVCMNLCKRCPIKGGVPEVGE